MRKLPFRQKQEDTVLCSLHFSSQYTLSESLKSGGKQTLISKNTIISSNSDMLVLMLTGEIVISNKKTTISSYKKPCISEVVLLKRLLNYFCHR